MAHTFITMNLDTALSILENEGDPNAIYLIDPVSQAASDCAEALAVVESAGGYIAQNGNIYFD